MFRLRVLFFSLLVALNLFSQSKNAIRAVWLTTAYGLDWPHKGAALSRDEMDAMLDSFYELNINTVMFQCRIRGDVVYKSDIEPQNSIFRDFDYDVLDYVIKGCHRRGMECHAWMVCIPVGTDRTVRSNGNMSVVRKKKNIVQKSAGQWYMNPANPVTAAYIAGLASEITRKYDIDGIHLDYIRYPDNYRDFPSRKWASAKNASQQRRNNITAIVKKVSEEVRKIKGDVEISCATIGKYADTRRFSSFGWNAYESLGQDVGTWLEKGYVDVVYPMLYFSDANFYPFVADWKERFGTERIVPVLGIYKLDAVEGDWPLGEIERQINFCRNLGIENIGFYRAGYLMENTKGISFILKNKYMWNRVHRPSVVSVSHPEFSVGKPSGVKAALSGKCLSLEWSRPADVCGEVSYIIYGSDTFPVDTSNPDNIIDIDVKDCRYSYLPVYSSDEFRYFAVSAMDAAGNESEPVYISMPDRRPRYIDFVESGAYLFR